VILGGRMHGARPASKLPLDIRLMVSPIVESGYCMLPSGVALLAGCGAKTRQLQYKLVPGEAGWLLKLDRTTDF
jgi:hypothetical protein